MMLAVLAVDVVAPQSRKASTGAARKKLTLERLYSYPRLEGTAPVGAKWSPDGKNVAFLWNDHGMRFRDLWLYEIEGGNLTRLTNLQTPRDEWTREPADEDPKLARYPPPESGLAAFEWAKDSQKLGFAFRGELYLVRTGGDVERLTKTREVESRPKFSPDSSKLAHASGTDLWLRDLVTGQIVQLTSGGSDDVLNGAPPFPESTARLLDFSPDGRWVAFLQIDRGGEPTRLIPNYVGRDVGVRRQRRTFARDETPKIRLGLVPADGGAVVWLTSPDRHYYEDWQWSPDSTRISLHRVEENWKRRHLDVIEAKAAIEAAKMMNAAETGEKRKPGDSESEGKKQAAWVRTIYSESDDKWVCTLCGPVAWSPDGRHVLFLSERDGWNHLYLIAADAAGGTAPRQLTRGPWEVETAGSPVDLWPQFDADGARVYFTASREDRSRRDFYRLELGSGALTRLTDWKGYNAATVAPDGKHVALLFSSFDQPWDLYVGVSALLKWKRVTVSPLAEFADHDWPQPAIVEFPARDRNTVRALLFRPAASAAEGARGGRTAKTPVISFVHGAGYAQAVLDRWGGYLTARFQFNQFLTQQGYAVIDVDYRGSSGYGRDWRTDVYLHLGGKDLEDQLAAMDYLDTLGWVDTGRAGIWGVSYGGFMTLMALFQSPDTFKAGSAWASVTDWSNYMRHYTQQRLRTPETEPEAYKRSSPIHHVARLKARLQIVHGMVDDNVHFQDAVQLIQALEAADKQFDLVLYPLESHAWSREMTWKHSTRATFEFFERHLRSQ